MSDGRVDALIVVALFLIVALPMVDEGNPLAAAGFAAFLMIAYGFGRVLWSERRLSEWRGWLAMVAGTAIALYLWNPLLFAYAGLAIFAQTIARLVASVLAKSDRDDIDGA